MKFWDTSAIVPLLVRETHSAKQEALLRKDPHMIACWTTECECYSALARLERDGHINPRQFEQCEKRLDALTEAWQVVLPEGAFFAETKRVLRLHPVRCADAFQLASAILASQRLPRNLEFVTLDERLAHCAAKEGFKLSGLYAS